MPDYIINGKSYFFKDDIGQEKAEEIIARENSDNPSGSDTYEGFFTEAGEGVASGVANIFEGVVTLPTLAVDLVAGTNATEAVENWFDEAKEGLGIDPEGAAGKVTEALVQFGIPGIGAASVIGKAGRVARIASGKSKIGLKSVARDKIKQEAGEQLAVREARELGKKYGSVVKGRKSALTKSQRAGLVARQITGAGLADAVVATDGTQTLGDFFEQGPTQTVSPVGLEGRDLAFQKIKNKLSVGLEGAVATGVIPPVVGASFKTISKVAAIRPFEGMGSSANILDVASLGAIPATRKLVEKGGEFVGRRKKRVLESPEDLTSLDKIVGYGASLLTYGGFLDPIVARAKSLVNPFVEGATKQATNRIKRIDKEIKQLLKTQPYRDLPDLEKRKIVDNFMDVLEGADPADLGLGGTQLGKLYSEAKQNIDDLSKRILNSAAFKALPEVAAKRGQMTQEKFRKQLTKNMSEGGYLRRLYRIFNDKDYVLKPEDKKIILDKVLSGEGINYGHVKGVLKNSDVPIDEAQMAQLMSGTAKLTDRQAKAYVDRYLKINKERGAKNSSGSTGRIFNVRLDTSLLAKRKVDSEVQRLILGEIRDPREAYVATVSELSNFIASDKMLNIFKQNADASIAATKAKNAENIANDVRDPKTKEIVQEKQLFFKMDDEILNIVKSDNELLAKAKIEKIEDLKSVSQLDAETIGDAVGIWQGQNSGFEILGRTIDTAGLKATDPMASPIQSVFGNMFGYAIPRAMYNNMSSKVWADGDAFPMLLRYLYQPMMKLKGISQYSKTILSPITQVRNVTSAAMFALANGNFGKGASLGTSVNVVLRDIIDKELKLGGKTFDSMKMNNEVLDFLSDLQERGVIGSSAQLREIQDNLRKGMGYDRQDQAQYASTVAAGGDEVTAIRQNPQFKATHRSKLGQFFKTARQPFEDLYKGGDDIWKIYNYTFEMNKFRNARRKIQNAEIKKVKQSAAYKAAEGNNELQLKIIGDATRLADEKFGKHIAPGEVLEPKMLEERLKQFAADNVRNLVPNYELVPEAIVGLRGTPFGNFVAFPAEILRTGFNIAHVAMKELASDDAAIRELGVRRLMGATTSFALLGTGLQEFGKMMTGTSSEDVDAINRLAAPYQRNAQFIPVGKDEKGNPEVIDFSHTNPYDMLSKPFYTMFRSLREGSRLDKDGIEKTRTAMFETMGEFFEPFFGVSMIFESFSDVLPREGVTSFGVGRGGETKSGAKVYKEADDPAKQVEKSLIHVINTILPNMAGIRVPVGADVGASDFSFTPIKSIEAGRFLRGTFMDPDSVEPTTGRKYTAGGEIFRAFTGLNTQIIDREKVMGFKSQEFKSERSGASTLFNDVLFLESPTSETFLEGYKRADAARLRAFRKLKLATEDLKKLGLSDSKIREVMRDKGLGRDEINSVLNDMYRAFRPSDAKRKEAIRKGFDYPFGEIQDLIDLTDFKSITPQEPVIQKKDPLDLSNLTIQTPEVSSNVSAEPQTLNVSSLDQVIAPAVNTTSTARNTPSFLGSNPADIAKNMDIARRTG